MRIEPAGWDDPAVQLLATAQQADLRRRYGGGQETGTPPSAADVAAVVLARADDGTPLGGYRRVPDAADSLFFERVLEAAEPSGPVR